MTNDRQFIASRCRAVALTVILMFAAAGGASYAQVPVEKETPSAPERPAAIPLAEVATRATELTTYLATLPKQSVLTPEMGKIRQSFFKLLSEIDRSSYDIETILRGKPRLSGLQAQISLWQPRQLQISNWLKQLTQQAVDLQAILKKLAAFRTTWTATLEAGQATQAPEATLQQIETLLAALEEARAPLQARHDSLLNLQSLVSKELARCDDVLTRIDQAQKGVVAGILTQEQPAVWRVGYQLYEWRSTSGQFQEKLADLYDDISRYVRDPSRELPLHAGLLVLLIGAFTAARRFLCRREADLECATSLATVFERPYAAAFFTVWFVASRHSAGTPQMLRELIAAVAVISVVRLVQTAVRTPVLPWIYFLSGLFVLDIVREVFTEGLIFEQYLLLLESAAGVAGLIWLLTNRRLIDAFDDETSPHRIRIAATVSKVVILMLACGAAAAALGYLPIGRIITPGTISAGALALGLYAALRVFGGIVALALRIWPLNLLTMVQRHRDLFEKRAHRLLVLMAVIGWAARSLDHVNLLDPILSAAGAILTTRFERGAVSISIEDILAFGLTLWIAYLLSKFIRFALQEDVYPRARIPSGTAYASSRLVHYTVIAVGFLVSLAILGMDLSRVTVLAGAFGVGIGFGLQSVVNNFVCGLILLFERPIHVGDTIETGQLIGEVRRIGIRASTVRTRQGADIIIPNAQFITANVTNWTFSDRLRRIDLKIGVNYASAPQRVIEVLEEVARINSKVLEYPAPQCLFMGYGDNSIDFELRAWTERHFDYNRVRSELNAAIYDAVKASGMSFPFPQREVRLLNDGPAC